MPAAPDNSGHGAVIPEALGGSPRTARVAAKPAVIACRSQSNPCTWVRESGGNPELTRSGEGDGRGIGHWTGTTVREGASSG
jgi:hypothetical protein